MIASSLETFEQTDVITGYLFSVDLFEYKMVAMIKQFQIELVKQFFRFFQVARNVTYINQIFAYRNNAQYDVIGSPPNDVSIRINGYAGYNGSASYTCSCANDISCKSGIGLFAEQSGLFVQHMIPG